MILSLQGCMAVGKTTAVRYLQENAPYIHISYEDNKDIIEEVKRRELDKNRYEDYLEIQKLWLRQEVLRYEKAIRHSCSIMDFGAEEIEFYTLNYPKSIGEDWEVEEALKKELSEVRNCLPDRILFLDASDEVLRFHKQHDDTRARNFFEHHLQHMMPLKRKWFRKKENVDWLMVDDLSVEEMCRKVKDWCDACISSKEQITRIERYETLMREAELLMEEPCGEDAGELRRKMEALEAYYGSEEWKKDFADDEAGLLPAGLKRGVLSEDGIYNLLERYRERE